MLDRVLDLLNGEALKDIWAEDETIGWIYQYFTPKELRDQARKESQAPRNSYELAFRNQFYTPRYVVQFLTDNTLGRLWYEMRQGDTALVEQCQYLVRRPNEVFLEDSDEWLVTSDESGAAGDGSSRITDHSSHRGDQSQGSRDLQTPVYIPYRRKKDPRDLKILDPASGSGHFLLYCFDLLETIYQEAYADPDLPPFTTTGTRLADDYPSLAALKQAIPALILRHNLHSLDIDPRAVQIASLALWLRAQRTVTSGKWSATGDQKSSSLITYHSSLITKTNLVTAEPMPGDQHLLQEFTAALQPPVLGQLVKAVFRQMELAGEAGALLKIEEEIEDAIAAAKKQWLAGPRAEQLSFWPEAKPPQAEQLALFDLSGITDEAFWEQAEELVLAALRDYAERATGEPGLARRLFAEDVVQGFAFIDLCRKRFDVVLMNPPFGTTSQASKQYCDTNYMDARADIGMTFVDRGLGFCEQDGMLGAITSRVMVANDSMEKWRANRLIAGGHLRSFIDLGYGVLDEAMVEAAAYCLSVAPNPSATFFLRVLDEREKEAAVSQFLVDGKRAPRTIAFWRDLKIFEQIPSKVLCYWLPQPLLASIANARNLVSEGGNARHGLQTTDDFRFLRLVWEVNPNTVGKNKKWVHFAKGGEYRPYWDDLHLVLNWENDGEELKSFVSAKAERTLGSAGWSRWINAWDDYFKPGLTFPERTTSDFSPRILPANCIFSATGEAIIFEKDETALSYLAGAYTRYFKLMIDGFVGSGDSSVPGSAAKHYRSGLINALPPPCRNLERASLLSKVLKGIDLARSFFAGDETSRDFIIANLLSSKNLSLKEGAAKYSQRRLDGALHLLDISWQTESRVAAYLGFSSIDVEVVDTIIGPHPMSYSNGKLEVNIYRLHKLWSNTESRLIAHAVKEKGARRQLTKKSYFGDRRLELLSHLFNTSPLQLIQDLKKEKLLGTELILDEVPALISYILGCSFGRWDIRIAQDSSLTPKLPDPLEPLPICPPGMLISPDGLPATSGHIVSEEWLRARPDAITLPPEGSVQQPTIPDSEYPIAVDWDGLLVDDPDHPDDIVRRVRDVLDLLWGDSSDKWKVTSGEKNSVTHRSSLITAEQIEQEACDILGVKTLRDYFRKPGKGGFWDDHVKRYSKSRRKAPIYWLLQSSRKNYALWLYYHRLDKDLLYKALVNYVEPKLRLEESKVEAIQGQLQAALSGQPSATKSHKALEKDLDQQDSFVAELRDFHDKLRRAAHLNLEPDLNDGVVLNIAPLWELVPWKEAQRYWEALLEGKYAWSSIGRQLREKGVVK